MWYKIKRSWVPTALAWTFLGSFLVIFLNSLAPAIGLVLPNQMWIGMVVSAVLTGVLVVFFQLKTGGFFERIRWRSVLLSVIGVVVIYVIQVGLSWLMPGPPSANEAGINDLFKGLSPLNVIFLQVLITVVGPITEETIFRGWMVWALSKWYRVLRYGIPIFLFTYMHSPTRLVDWLSYGSMAIILMAIRVRTGKVQYSVLTHIAWNTLATFVP